MDDEELRDLFYIGDNKGSSSFLTEVKKKRKKESYSELNQISDREQVEVVDENEEIDKILNEAIEQEIEIKEECIVEEKVVEEEKPIAVFKIDKVRQEVVVGKEDENDNIFKFNRRSEDSAEMENK